MNAGTTTHSRVRRGKSPDIEPVDTSVASDGMTIDTPRGPVDLVAIERARAWRPVELSAAEVAYLYAHLREREPLTEAQEHRAS